jgi:uncharacterized Zn finger protein (UPF0148 family)
MATTCPNCGTEIPPEIGQHAVVPTAGIVSCPNCGATVTLETRATAAEEGAQRPADETQTSEGSEETFSGEETIEGVMEEISEKEGGRDD